MDVIELQVGDGNPESSAQSKILPEWLRWQHWRKYVVSGMAGIIAMTGFDARVDDDAVREAQAAASARQADAAARRMNAWIGDRLFGKGKAPIAGNMLGGIVEIVEDGKVTWRAANPLAVTAVDREVYRDDSPDIWVLVQEVYGIGQPKFRPVEFRAVRLGDSSNVRVRLSGSETAINLNPCQDHGYATSAIGICAADIRTGQEFTPPILPGLVQRAS